MFRVVLLSHRGMALVSSMEALDVWLCKELPSENSTHVARLPRKEMVRKIEMSTVSVQRVSAAAWVSSIEKRRR